MLNLPSRIVCSSSVLFTVQVESWPISCSTWGLTDCSYQICSQHVQLSTTSWKARHVVEGCEWNRQQWRNVAYGGSSCFDESNVMLWMTQSPLSSLSLLVCYSSRFSHHCEWTWKKKLVHMQSSFPLGAAYTDTIL